MGAAALPFRLGQAGSVAFRQQGLAAVVGGVLGMLPLCFRYNTTAHAHLTDGTLYVGSEVALHSLY